MKWLNISLSLIILGGCVMTERAESQPIPVIIDTDIGHRIDDTWAIILALCCQELDVKLIITDSHDTVGKAKIVSKLLDSLDRADIPIGIGKKQDNDPGPQIDWVKEYKQKDYSGTIHQDGIQAMIDIVMASQEPVTLLVLGPCPNLLEAVKREPKIVSKVKIIAMSGSIKVGYNDMPGADAEYNIRSEIEAARALYSQKWDLTIAPLDITNHVIVRGEQYRNFLIADNPTSKTLLAAYSSWAKAAKSRVAPNIRSTILFDTVPVYLAADGSLCEIEDMKLKIDNRGILKNDPNGKTVHVAMRWKSGNEAYAESGLDRFISQFLIPRYTKGVIPQVRRIRPD